MYGSAVVGVFSHSGPHMSNDNECQCPPSIIDIPIELLIAPIDLIVMSPGIA